MRSAYLLTLKGEGFMKKLNILPENFGTKSDIYTDYLNLDILRIIEAGGIVKIFYEDKKKEIVGLASAEFNENFFIIPYLFAPNLPLKIKLLSEIINDCRYPNILIKISNNDEKFINYLKENNFKLINSIILFLGNQENLKPEIVTPFEDTLKSEKMEITTSNLSPIIYYHFLTKEGKCIGVLNAQKVAKDFPIIKINTIYIDEKFRKRNFGSLLLSSFLKCLLGERNYYVISEVPMGNLPAIRLFSKFNFGIIGAFKILMKRR
jgi:ribosomal protein S18 acetylase RimI-like enzyme